MPQENGKLTLLVDRFARAECSWMSTVRPDGRAHCVPVWHVWMAGSAYIITRSQSVKARNIQSNPSAVLAHPDPYEPVILEGKASLAQEQRARLAPLFLEKYDWELSSSPDYDCIIRIQPVKVLAWNKGESPRRYYP